MLTKYANTTELEVAVHGSKGSEFKIV